MQDLRFYEIPSKYNLMKEQINDFVIQKIYNLFSFEYFQFRIYEETKNIKDKIQYEKDFEDFLFTFLRDFKFITYNTSNVQIDDINANNDLRIVNINICIEGKFIILENISFEFFNKIINRLKNQKISIIKVIYDFEKSENTDNEENQTKNEIINFCKKFQNEIKNNFFVSTTITALSSYLIFRNFYPSDYFKDRSFFIFNPKLNFNENESKSLLNKIIFEKKQSDFMETNKKFIAFSKSLIPFFQNKVDYQNFKKEDFIVLKTISSNDKENLKLVLHIDSFYLFLMKEVFSKETIQNEIKICEKYSNRCFVHFYGFVKEGDENIGFIYDYMCNSSLKSFIENNDQFNMMKITTIINRIYQGLRFLSSNSLIHRDLKPSNILLDHDFIPYFANFDNEFESNDESMLFSSPEQKSGYQFSFSTDIFSFGSIIYFLFEKKSPFLDFDKSKKNATLPKIKNCSENIQNIYQKCVKYSPNERISCNEIQKNLINEVNSFSYFDNYLFEETNCTSSNDLMQFVYESFILQFPDVYLMMNFVKFFFVFQRLYFLKLDENYSEMFLQLGHEYANGSHLEQDYLKAKKCYEKSAKFNNAEALLSIAALYKYGCGVDQSDLKAIEYYEKAAELNEPSALYSLGKHYYEGDSVEKDYKKAIDYFNRSAELNDSSSLLALGNIYSEGKAVKINYAKAKEYFEKAANLNNKNAVLSLGEFYEKGCGVKKDYVKAKNLYEKACQLGSSFAFYNLGYLYEKGLGVEKDYIKAKKFYEISSESNNSLALLRLLYIHGFGVKRDFSKGISFLEKSASLKNIDATLALGRIYLDVDNNKSLDYYKSASNLNSSDAFFMLGFFYSNGIIFDFDLNKASLCFRKCIDLGQIIRTRDESDDSISFITNSNLFYYLSYNYLGLIYLLVEKNVDLANEYLKEAALKDYSFGQNNFGLLNQFYLNEPKISQLFYQKASQKKFALAEFNLAYLREKEGNFDESIKFFQLASDHENEASFIHNCFLNDRQFEISKIFIFCFTNLKLVNFYFSKNKTEESKKCFVKALSKLAFLNFFVGRYFRFLYQKGKNLFLFLKDFILNSPFFNLINQENLDFHIKFTLIAISMLNKMQSIEKYNSDEIIFNNPADLFEFVMRNAEQREKFTDEIKDILYVMEKILYTAPYPILFGRISLKFDNLKH